MNIESKLRDYKRKKSIIKTTLLRIEAFEKALQDPDCYLEIFLNSPPELGMPRSTSPVSPVEISVTDREKQVEILKQWIKDDKSRIYPYQIELEQIDVAMGALTKQEKFVVESKYFERLFWRDIEISFNDTFRQQNYITVSGIRKINDEAIETLTKILEPFYNRFKIKK